MLDRKSLGILFCTLFLLMLGVGIIIPNIAYLAQEHGATPFQVGLMFTLYSLFQFLFAPLWGRLSDRLGRKPVLLVGLLGNGLGLLWFGIASGLPFLYAARAFSGLTSSAALPTAMAYVADSTDEAGRGRGMGLLGAAMGLGFIFGPVFGGFLSRLGHDVPFLVAGLLNFMTCALAALLLPESLGRRGAPEPLPAPRAALRHPLLPFFVVAFFVTFAMAALESVFAFFIQDRFGYGAFDMSVMLLFMGLAVSAVQGFGLGRWIEAIGEEGVLVSGLLINAAGFLFIVAAAGRGSLTAALVISGVGNQIMRPTNASLITRRTTLGQGLSIGIMDSFDSAGRILGPIAAGGLYRWEPRLPYVASAAILAAVGAVLWTRRRGRAAEGLAPVTPPGDAS